MVEIAALAWSATDRLTRSTRAVAAPMSQFQGLVVVGRAWEAFADQLDAPPVEESVSAVFYR